MPGRVGRKDKCIGIPLPFYCCAQGCRSLRGCMHANTWQRRVSTQWSRWWSASSRQINITINQWWWQTADAWQAMKGQAREVRGEGQDGGWQAGGGCATKAILMMKTLGQPGNKDDLPINWQWSLGSMWWEMDGEQERWGERGMMGVECRGGTSILGVSLEEDNF